MLATIAFTPQEISLVVISVRGWVDPRAIVQAEVNEKFQRSHTELNLQPSGFVARYLNQLSNNVPLAEMKSIPLIMSLCMVAITIALLHMKSHLSAI